MRISKPLTITLIFVFLFALTLQAGAAPVYIWRTVNTRGILNYGGSTTISSPTQRVVLYQVRAGDTLYLLAQRYHTTVSEIIRLNNLRTTQIYVGQRLLITSKVGQAPEPTPTPKPLPEPKPQPAPAPAPQPEMPNPGPGQLTADEQMMFTLINQERQKAGLRPYQIDMRLVEQARLKAEDMIAKNYFSHTSPTYGSPFQQMRTAGINYRAAGENLAGAATVQQAHTSLMNSTGHRANILSSNFTHVGIGIIDGGPYGKMFVQMFASF